jgi:hypothetical protein
MNLGQKINEFDNSLGTVKEFNAIFKGNKPIVIEGSVCPYPSEVEILGIPIGKPFFRKLLVNGKAIEYDFFAKKKIKQYSNKGKRKSKKVFVYKLYKDGNCIKKTYEMATMAVFFKAHPEAISKKLRQNGGRIEQEGNVLTREKNIKDKNLHKKRTAL